MNGPVPVRAFISWAHSSPGWSHEQATTWATTVATFAATLRMHGIDADADLFHVNDLGIDWTRFGPLAIANADVTLVAVSPGWRERWEGRNEPTVGAGAAQEADQLHGMFQADQQDFQRRVMIVVLPGGSSADIPNDLRRLQRFDVQSFELGSLAPLLRTLLGKPEYVAPPLGTTPDLPPQQLVPSPPSASGGAAADAARHRAELAQAVAAGERAARGAADAEAPRVVEGPAVDLRVDGSPWLPMQSRGEPMTTRLDDRARMLAAQVELHLVARDRSPVLAIADLRAATSRLRETLESLRPTPASLLTWMPLERPRAEVRLVDDVAVVTVERPTRRASVLPEMIVEIRVSRQGDVCVVAELARDGMGSLISQGSLAASLRRLLDVAVPLVPSSVEQAVPIVRLGPLMHVGEGNPAQLGSRNSATLPWPSQKVVTTPGTDAVARVRLGADPDAIVDELVAQIAAALQR